MSLPEAAPSSLQALPDDVLHHILHQSNAHPGVLRLACVRWRDVWDQHVTHLCPNGRPPRSDPWRRLRGLKSIDLSMIPQSLSSEYGLGSLTALQSLTLSHAWGFHAHSNRLSPAVRSAHAQLLREAPTCFTSTAYHDQPSTPTWMGEPLEGCSNNMVLVAEEPQPASPGPGSLPGQNNSIQPPWLQPGQEGQSQAGSGSFLASLASLPGLVSVTVKPIDPLQLSGAISAGVCHHTIPKFILSLTRLTHLDLSCCQLAGLPRSISSLQSAQSLLLPCNMIKSLPRSLCTLTRLTELDVSTNALTRLPLSFSRLTQLRLLDLSYNPLQPSAAGVVGRLRSLQDLKAGGLAVVSTYPIPPAASSGVGPAPGDLSSGPMDSEEGDDVDGSEEEEQEGEEGQQQQQQQQLGPGMNPDYGGVPQLGGGLPYLSSSSSTSSSRAAAACLANQLALQPGCLGLTSLDLGNNSLEGLPGGLGRLQQLRHLDLSCNSLAQVPPQLLGCSRLQWLDLSGNRLGCLPEGLAAWSGLQELRLQRNVLATLPSCISQLHQLKHLNLHCNQLTCLPQGFWAGLRSLQSLHLSCNYLTELPPRLSCLTALTFLNVSHNELRSLPAALGKLSRLQQLDVYANRLTTLPASIGALINLQQLQLSFNRLRELPPTLGGCSGLTSLSIARNSLGRLPDSLSELQQLASLDASCNLLRGVAGVLGHLRGLRQLDLQGNCISNVEQQQLVDMLASKGQVV